MRENSAADSKFSLSEMNSKSILRIIRCCFYVLFLQEQAATTVMMAMTANQLTL